MFGGGFGFGGGGFGGDGFGGGGFGGGGFGGNGFGDGGFGGGGFGGDGFGGGGFGGGGGDSKKQKGKAPVKYETLYHGTNGEWAGSIGKKGLIPSTNGRLGPGVYLTPKQDAAWRWANTWQDMPYVLTCKVPSDEISARAIHPGYPDREMPPFPEVVVRNPMAVEITHVKGVAFVDHAVREKKKQPTARKPKPPTFQPSKPDPNGVRSSRCHLRDVWKFGSATSAGSGARCSKCCRMLAPMGEWACKKCGKCSNCQPQGPDPSVKRAALEEAGLHHFVAMCDEQKAEDKKASAAAAKAAKAEARAKAAEERVAKAAANAAAKAVAKAVTKAATPHATSSNAPPAAPPPATVTGTGDRGSQVTRRLAEHSLEEYAARLIGEGYDDLEDLLSMSKAEIEQVADRCGMKPGHTRRLLKAFGHLGAMSGCATNVLDALAPPILIGKRLKSTDATDQWACSECTYRNDANALLCSMCDTVRSAVQEAELAADQSGRAQEDPVVIDDSDDPVDDSAAKRAKIASQ